MKRIAVLLALCTVFFVSCSKSDSAWTCVEQPVLAGTWKLIETLADPGDGSGTWQPAEKALTLSFGTKSVSGDAFPQARSYEVVNDKNLRFTFEDGTFIIYNYQLSETTLTLSGGGCIEDCGAKFVKAGS